MFIEDINDYVLRKVKDGARVISAKKSATVKAVIGSEGEVVATEIDNTTNTVKVDVNGNPDWIVTNPGGERYIVTHEKFREIYESTGEPDMYQKKAIQLLVYCDTTVEFEPSWGGSFTVEEGGYFTVNGYRDIAGVQKLAFTQTYTLVSETADDRDKVVRILSNLSAESNTLSGYFDCVQYLKKCLGGDYCLVPPASIDDCKTKQDCDDLVNMIQSFVHK